LAGRWTRRLPAGFPNGRSKPGRDGVLIGGVMYGWERIELFSIQSSRIDKTSAYRYTLRIKLKNWPWKVYASMTDGEFESVQRPGLRTIGGGAVG